MKTIKRVFRPVSILMVMIMVMVTGPIQTAAATMIGTRTVVDVKKAQNTRETLKRLLDRKDVQEALIGRGIQPAEARNRIDSLTDREVMRIAAQMDRLPAGAGLLEFIGLTVVIGFFVLLITDMLGFTDIFPFINPPDKR